MKAFIILSLAAISFSACSNNNTATNNSKASDSATQTATATPSQNTSVSDVVSAYLELKNALANDNSQDAARAAKTISEKWQKMDKNSFTPEQKKVYDNVDGDIKENADHIGANADKIAHQREHFEMLSKDIYDLTKAVKSNQTLYKDFCPMYNNGKGASWISETKEIKNPYLGKKMSTCGSIKEEIK